MAETAQQAQIAGAERAQTFTRDDVRRGHWLGFGAITLAMVGAVLVSLFGYPWVGAALVGVPVMGVAKALIDSARVRGSGPSDAKARTLSPRPGGPPDGAAR
jgi:hypothetical protein